MSESPSTDDDASSDTTRRSVLKAAGATAAAGLGGVAASTAASDVEQVPADQSAIEAVFDWHAGDLLEALAADGLVESADVAALDTRPADFSTAAGDLTGTTVLRSDGVHLVQTMQSVGEDVLAIVVALEEGKAYAWLRRQVGEDLLYDVDAGRVGDEVSTASATCPSCECSPLACNGTRSEDCNCCDDDGECVTVHFCDC